MATLEEIRNKVIKAIQDDNDESFSVEEIDAEINEGLKYVSRNVALTALEATGTFDTELNTDVVSIPTDWNYQRRLHNATSSAVKRIKVATSINLLRNKYPISLEYGPEYGDVDILAIFNNQITYYPIPQEVQTVTCKFYQNPTPLVEDTDIPTCLPDGTHIDLLKNYALWKLNEIIEDGVEGAKVNTRYYKNEFKEALGELDDHIDEGQSSTDPIRDNGWI